MVYHFAISSKFIDASFQGLSLCLVEPKLAEASLSFVRLILNSATHVYYCVREMPILVTQVYHFCLSISYTYINDFGLF